ncbi:MAG: exo-alpha-sialidase [Lentisphaerae bacterium]|jgi:hypothetical protein|nr:exo-alpha-sialidase [Lentisphaerota bacterium]
MPAKTEMLAEKIKVTIHDPVLVACSAAGETRWGFHQFPALGRLPDGRMLIMYADAEDASETHGAAAPCFVSDNEGASWEPINGGIKPTRPHYRISAVFDGEYLVTPSLPYLDVVESGITLPEPVATGDTYGTVFTYRLRDLPPAAQEYFRYLPALRWRPGAAVWEDTVVEYDTNGLLAWRRDNSRLLPRTFFERTLLRFKGELLYPDYRARYERDDGSVASKGFTTLMVSTDNGRSFKRRGTVAMDAADNDLMGEPQLSPTADGRLVCVIRRTDQTQKPMCITWSEDSGHTWTPPQRLFDFGVWPSVLLMGNGAMVLSYGRPGVHMAIDPNGTGATWAIREALIPGDHEQKQRHSCGYTSLLPIDDDSFLIAYSDFLYKNNRGEPCKAILTRRVEVRRGNKEAHVDGKPIRR